MPVFLKVRDVTVSCKCNRLQESAHAVVKTQNQGRQILLGLS